ncbi:ABC transporter permease [Nocardioides jishulii]|uniref:ABC transporter permease n=1 Tax=Nocardioides jishulii TaxID=2575440 RepID=A0A4U2YT18_9ACTN|nr:ABC transporter permease [Nocardioides jishulii]QCX28480.1 ABC transporter permease [Nocardioides jishulii]TKI64627.1 ABC transporter permease [Nocardioides jishulii]
MRALAVLTLNDLKQGLRDRSVVIFGVIVPLVLMFVFNLVFGDTEERELAPITVAVAAPAGDEVAATVTEVLGQLDEVGLEVTVVEAGEEEARAGEEELSLVFPPGTTAEVSAGRSVTVEAIEGDDGSGLEDDLVVSVVDEVLQQYARGAVTVAAGASVGLPPAEFAELARDAAEGGPAYELVRGEASDEQLSAGAALVAGQAGLFLLFTVSFGVTNLLVERENGTLPRLRSLPIRRRDVVLSKALASMVTGVLSLSVLLTVGGWFFDAHFGSPWVVATLAVAASAAATSLMFVLVRVAATSEQASVATSIFAIVLGVGGGAFFPVSADSAALSTLLDLNPVAALLRGLGISSAGGSLADVAPPLAVMVVFAAVMALVSRFVPDRGAMS